MSAVTRAQLAFVAAEFAADIGDDDPEAGEPFHKAFHDLTTSRPENMQDAAVRLRFMAYVGERYAGSEEIGERVREGMLQVAAWLALAVTSHLVHDHLENQKAA